MVGPGTLHPMVQLGSLHQPPEVWPQLQLPSGWHVPVEQACVASHLTQLSVVVSQTGVPPLQALASVALHCVQVPAHWPTVTLSAWLVSHAQLLVCRN